MHAAAVSIEIIAISALFAIPLAYIVNYLRRTAFYPMVCRAAQKCAIERGHVVYANLVSAREYQADGDKSTYTYRYSWDGQTYDYKYRTTSNTPARELTLYFERDPALADVSNHVGMVEQKLPRIYLVCLFINLIIAVIIAEICYL